MQADPSPRSALRSILGSEPNRKHSDPAWPVLRRDQPLHQHYIRQPEEWCGARAGALTRHTPIGHEPSSDSGSDRGNGAIGFVVALSKPYFNLKTLINMP